MYAQLYMYANHLSSVGGQTPNPSINTDWRNKAASAGYVKHWASQVGNNSSQEK